MGGEGVIANMLLQLTVVNDASSALRKVDSEVNTLEKSTGQAMKTWNEFTGERMGAYMKQYGSHEAAIRKISQEWKEYKASIAAAGEATSKASAIMSDMPAKIAAATPHRSSSVYQSMTVESAGIMDPAFKRTGYILPSPISPAAPIAVASMSEKIAHFTGSLESMGHFVERGFHMLDRFEISQLSVANATNTVENAQIRYNATVAKFGENSAQAIIAHHELERAQNMLHSANLRSQASMVMLGVSALSMVPQLITAGQAIVAFARTGQIAIGGLTLTMSTLAPWIVGIGAALSVSYYLFNRNAEAAYDLSTQQQALALSAEEYNMATSSMFSLLSPLEAAQGTLAEKQIATKKAFDDWQKAIEEFSENSPEAQAAYARYKQAVAEQEEAEKNLIKTEEDLQTEIKNTSKTIDAETHNWKTAFKNTVIDIGSGLWGLVSTVGTTLDNIIQNWYTKWNDLGSYSDKAWLLISTSAKLFFPGIGSTIVGVWETVYNTAHEIWDTLQSYLPTSWGDILTKAEKAFEDIKNAIIGPFQSAYDYVYGLWQRMTSWSWSLGGGGSSGGGGGGGGSSDGYYSSEAQNTSGNYYSGTGGGGHYGFGNVPMAEGGDFIVSRPTHFIAGEAGPERATFTPLHKARGFGGGEITVINQFNAPIYGIDDLNRAMDEAIDRLKWNIRSLGG